MSYVAAENTLSDMRQLTDILEERAYDEEQLLGMSEYEVSALRNIPAVASYLAELAQECLEAYQEASAYDLDKALPEQQAVRRRGDPSFRFAELQEGSGPYMGYGFESEGTIHPAILGMMARREKEDQDRFVDEHEDEPNPILRPKRKTVGRGSRGKATPIEEQRPGKLMGRGEYPESFDVGWQDKVHPGSGEFSHHEMSDGQRPHWISHPRRGEER